MAGKVAIEVRITLDKLLKAQLRLFRGFEEVRGMNCQFRVEEKQIPQFDRFKDRTLAILAAHAYSDVARGVFPVGALGQSPIKAELLPFIEN